MKKLSLAFAILAVLLSDAMCAVTAYHYCDLLWGGTVAGYSAPPSTAFVYAVPFAAGTAVCAALSAVFRKKAFQRPEQNPRGKS